MCAGQGCVVVGWGFFGSFFFRGPFNLSCCEFPFHWQMGIIPGNGQDRQLFCSFSALNVFQELKQHSSWLKWKADWQRGCSVTTATRGILKLYLNMVTLWHFQSGQLPSQLDRLGPSYAFNEQSSEKFLVTVGKKAGKQTIKSSHRMTSECCNKIRASNKLHFRQSRNSFSVECSGQIIISDVCQANAISLPKCLQAGSNGQSRVRPVAL